MTATKTHRPALCRIEFIGDQDEEFTEIARVAPWEMMITLPEADNDPCSFSIPISLGNGYHDGSFRFLIYVDENSRIPYHGPENDDYDPSWDGLICAVEYAARAPDEDDVADNKNNNGVRAPRQVVTDIKIISTKLNTKKLPKSFSNTVLVVGKDFAKENPHSTWPYHIYCSLGGKDSVGVEDIIWLRTPKDIGILPECPDGYAIYEDADFSDESAQVRFVSYL